MELAKAYVQIVPTTRGIGGQLERALNGEAEKAGDYAGKKLGGKLTSALGSATAFAGKMAFTGIIAGATATAAVVKNAVESYAEYEQLVGGIETMFEDLSYDVQENASKAFQTAGLSANEYMETVMGFSASLNQSLMATEGNISRSAELADQTIIDMADNANKMGTSMESIQNAYQGFAKGNYTMLDNLKLGYGGTKEEMERLLKDATDLSGVKYDISSFADISEAIHVIQTDLGITGTTAKEASTTISGSLSSMKAAWSNLLVGVADDTQDFGGLIDNFVSSVATVGKNIMPRVEVALKGVGNLVESLAPVITEGITTLVPNVLPSLLQAGLSVAQTLAQALIDNLPMLLDVAGEMLFTLADGLVENLPEIITQITTVVVTIVDYITGNIDKIVEVAALLVIALADGLIRNLPRLLVSVGNLVIALFTKIMEGLDQMRQVGIELIVGLVKGIESKISDVINKAKDIVTGFKDTIQDAIGNMVSIGLNLVQGIWQGISNGYTWITNKISGWVKDVLAFIKKAFGIASPSKLMRDEVGKYLAQGIWAGWEQENTFGNIEADIRTRFETISDNSLEKATSSGKNFIDYEKLGDAVAKSFEKSGLAIKVNNREIGRVVRTYA